MNSYATAEVVKALDADASYALVEDPAHVNFLQQECRIYGSLEGSAASTQRLRLALEEMAVGVAKGFLRLVESVSNNGPAAAGQNEVHEITQELTGGGPYRDPSGSVARRLSPQRHARLRVFRDLWERGYVVTFGSKFGADFLVYKDDPKRAHAVGLIVVKDYEEEFARVDVVSFCRVAKMVKKQLLFAGVQRNCEQVQDGTDEVADAAADIVVYISLSHALLVSRQEESEE